MDNIIEKIDSAEARAKRLRRLRGLADISRKEMCERYGIKPDTLVGWEVGRHGGLTKHGALKILECFKQEGIYCNVEWLLYGTGTTPTVIFNFNELKNSLNKETTDLTANDEQIINELIFFKNNNIDTFDFIIPDSSMEPHYKAGDCIAGIKHYKDKLHLLNGIDCIVKTMDGKTLFRKIAKSKDNKFNLVANNLNSDADDLMLQDVEIAYAAPVIWHRRKNIY